MHTRPDRLIRLVVRVLAAVALLGVAVVAALAVRRKKLLDEVSAELRHWILLIPTSITNRLSLKIARRIVALPTQPVDGCTMRDELIAASGTGTGPGVRVVVYEPVERQTPTGALLWIHGGGLVMASADQYHDVCSRFAAQLGIVVASVDYRLAPEYPFPAGLDDCMAALRWLDSEADRLGIDRSRMAVGGDSAGGGLAACVAQRARDEGGPALCFQLLQYPMLDDQSPLRDGHETLVWSRQSNAYAWSLYLSHEVTDDETRRYASAARCADMKGLPPAWIGIGTADLFHDESLRYAQRLTDAGVPCELHVVHGMYHGAERVRPSAPSMREFMSRMVEALGAATCAS
ncbi:MAG: alpha/beta hydrolase [Ilumatobacteraceae bacterium]